MAKQTKDWTEILVKRGVIGPDQLKEAQGLGNSTVEEALASERINFKARVVAVAVSNCLIFERNGQRMILCIASALHQQRDVFLRQRDRENAVLARV